jgi:coenzyme F420-dependent glucose-6-phosphate dehydrogenase
MLGTIHARERVDLKEINPKEAKMTKFGYAISSEEHHPLEIVRHAQMAESVGFSFAMISDHYHPWVSAQGHSPFVWSVIGALANATRRLIIGTGVTAPIIRIHPAIVAQAAATSAAMLPNRFFLGVGTGENLNEHEWTGETISYWGRFYTVEDAKLFTLPEHAPQIMVGASGPTMAGEAGKISDGLIATGPEKEVVEAFDAAGGKGKPRIGQLTVCWAPSEQEAKRTVHHIWPNSGLTGELSVELRTVKHFEQAVKLVTEEKATESVPCGPNPEKHVEAIRKYIDAGFDHVYFHQIGPDQEGFLRFYEREVLPEFS